jgi:alpha-amylase/alpha-mannosidase (GH57 family)
MATKAFSIHGHFYQPPREDPLSGVILPEAGAAPYRNFNEKIHAECYRPNADAGNFARLSFNIGPTLLSWMAGYDSITYQRILAQDQSTVARHGMGNAMAQGYNHTILPLASNADKMVQLYWGMADFTHRFGRLPKGLWLPETAVDTETLLTLARLEIEYVILAPWQARSASLDATEAYRVSLPDGLSMAVFFYQAELSGGISFNPTLTADADRFALLNLARHFSAEKEKRGEPQLVLVASDGDLYGHHQPFRDLFLARLLDGASAQAGLTPTFPALWLKQHPPRQTIEIRENTSWSCHHGLSRWLGSCPCTAGDGRWKMQLRRALDRLAAALDGVYFDAVYPHVPKPRLLRQRYIHARLGEISTEDLITEMAGHALTQELYLRLQLLLQAQYERQRMFTSCGWFHDDFDRLEPKHNLAYAAQAVRLTRIATGEDLTSWAIEDLKHVASPRTGLRGDTVFKQQMERTWMVGQQFN